MRMQLVRDGNVRAVLRAVHVVMQVPTEARAQCASFWVRALGWPVGPSQSGLEDFEPGDGHPYVHLDSSGRVGPRVHLRFTADDPHRAADELVGHGASGPTERDAEFALTSPGGMPFSVVEHRVDAVPAPVTFGGHRTRLVQVCIDAPADRFDPEVAFWRRATGWAWTGSDAVEFAGKLRPTPNCVQILLQRLDEPTGMVRAHIDLGTDDRGSEVGRLVEIGADAGVVGGGWQVMIDPTGMTFCVTDNPPT